MCDGDKPEIEGVGVIDSVATAATLVVVVGVVVVVVAMSVLALTLGAKRYCGPSCFEKYLWMVPSAEMQYNDELLPIKVNRKSMSNQKDR